MTTTNLIERIIGGVILAALAFLVWSGSPRFFQIPTLVTALLVGGGLWLMTDGFNTRTDKVVGGFIAGSILAWGVYMWVAGGPH